MSWLEAVAGNVTGGLLNHSLSMRRQEQAQNFESDMYQQRYQMTVRDLQAAGLNPMLAYTQGVGSAPSSSAAGASNSDLGSEAVAADNTTRIANAQESLLRAQKKQVEAQTENIDKTADIKGPAAAIGRAIEHQVIPFTRTSAEGFKNFLRGVDEISEAQDSPPSERRINVQEMRKGGFRK